MHPIEIYLIKMAAAVYARMHDPIVLVMVAVIISLAAARWAWWMTLLVVTGFTVANLIIIYPWLRESGLAMTPGRGLHIFTTLAIIGFAAHGIGRAIAWAWLKRGGEPSA
jgi:hypothetical protein